MAKILKPKVPKSFFYGKIVSWKFRDTITKDHGAYCIRFKLFFESGDVCNKQIGGFNSEKQAKKIREDIIAKLVNNEYIPFQYTVKECMDYWLYYYMLDEQKITYNTYYVYRNVLYNYLIKNLDCKMLDVTIDSLVSALRKIDKKGVQQSAIGAVYSFFKFAAANNIINFNPSLAAVSIIKSEIKPSSKKKKQRLIYSLEQVKILLYKCKENYPHMFLPLLLCLTCGVRISECIGIRYSDIDFINMWLYLEIQIGYTTNEDGVKEKKPKSDNGIRKIPIPKFVIDEIIVKRKQYEILKENNPDFVDNNYVCCKENGMPYNRGSFSNDYNALIKECGLHKIVWHDLRHTYATTLNNKVNLKAISMFLGHARPEFSLDTYIYKEPDPICDCSKYLNKIWEQVKPEYTKNDYFDLNISSEILEYILPNSNN